MAYQIAIYHRRKREELLQRYGAHAVYDLTSKGPLPWVRFSPFYPLEGIPVPFWPGTTAASVEGIWQGLKRFEFENEVDIATLSNRTMRNLKRTSRGKGKYGIPRGRILGHQFGVHEDVLLEYFTARIVIYLPSYRWVLEHKLQQEIESLRKAAENGPIILLDYETNFDYKDISKPLSHCALVRHYLSGTWPAIDMCAFARDYHSA